METTDKTKSPWGRFTVHDLFMIKTLVLLGFTNIIAVLHEAYIISKFSY